MSDGWEELTPRKATEGGWEDLSAGQPKRRLNLPLIAAPLDATAALVSGGAASVAGGLAGLAQGAKNLVSEGMPAGDRVRQVQEALTYQPRTELGAAAVDAISYPFEKLAEGADAAGGAVTDATGSPALGAGVNTAIQAAPALLGKVMSPAAKRAAVLERTRLEVEQRLGAPRDKVITQAKEAGLGISPAEANPTLLNRITEGFGGQAKTQLLQSEKNRPIVNKIVRKGLGIADDAPISMETLEAVRKQNGLAYEKVRGLGDIAIDEKYGASLNKIVEKYEGAAKSFPDEPSPVQKAVDSARKTVDEGRFDASAAVDKINIERGRADKAFRQGDTELGKAHKAIADAIEQQIDRHLNVSGLPPEAVAEMRKAREVIAKSYDVQKALKGNDVDTRVLAAQLKKGRLSGELKQLGEFGERFPGSAQVGGKNASVGPTIFDGGLGLGAVAGSDINGMARLAASAGASAVRPTIRSIITSRPYQNMNVNPPSYQPGAFRRLSEAATSDEAIAAAIALQAQRR